MCAARKKSKPAGDSNKKRRSTQGEKRTSGRSPSQPTYPKPTRPRSAKPPSAGRSQPGGESGGDPDAGEEDWPDDLIDVWEETDTGDDSDREASAEAERDSDEPAPSSPLEMHAENQAFHSLSAQIREILRAPDYQPLDIVGLGKRLRKPKPRLTDLEEVLRQLERSGELMRDGQGVIRSRESIGQIRGFVRKTASGSGFLIPRDRTGGQRDDIFIPQEELRDAHTGDEVLVQVTRRGFGQRARPRGRVVEILTRATETFVGTYLEQDGQGFVQVDGTSIPDPVRVGDPGAKGAIPGDKVVIEMLRFPSQFKRGEAVLTEVLGPRGRPGVDTLTIIHEFGLPDEFPEDVLEEARLQAASFDESQRAGRLDLTDDLIVTIDPADARDFDDAISLKLLPDGHWHLGVHIADVSTFVPSGSSLDREAYRRGTSVYLPDRVLPMLPEIISNGLASLQPDQPRYTKSVFIEFDADGMPLHRLFAHSIICSKRRFAYEQVLAILQHPHQHAGEVPADIIELVQRMHRLAEILRARRFRQGAIELDMPETKIDFDKAGKVSGAHVVPHDISHQLIEEFMLAANIAVATALGEKDIPFLRRVHGDPDERKLKDFARFVQTLGLPLKRYQSRTELQALLDRTKGTPLQQAVHFAFLRSMKQAQYSPEEVGHYALAAEHYCHFTSPIRRYPDLTIHRLFDHLVDPHCEEPYPGLAQLVLAGEHCSKTERRAAEAERELIKIKLLTYLSQHLGMELPATITGVREFGLFCQGIELPAEGIVHLSSLGDDYYDYDDVAQALIGRRTGKQFGLGQTVQTVVAHVDVDRRQLYLRLAGTKSRDEPWNQPQRAARFGSSRGSSRGSGRGSSSRGSGSRSSTSRSGERPGGKGPRGSGRGEERPRSGGGARRGTEGGRGKKTGKSGRRGKG